MPACHSSRALAVAVTALDSACLPSLAVAEPAPRAYTLSMETASLTVRLGL